VTGWLRARWEVLAAGAILAGVAAAVIIAAGRSDRDSQPPPPTPIDVIDIPSDTVPTSLFPSAPPPVLPSGSP
jgi:microcompartment protein CcmK/EutM